MLIKVGGSYQLSVISYQLSKKRDIEILVPLSRFLLITDRRKPKATLINLSSSLCKANIRPSYTPPLYASQNRSLDLNFYRRLCR